MKKVMILKVLLHIFLIIFISLLIIVLYHRKLNHIDRHHMGDS
jgi:hypothetical protein